MNKFVLASLPFLSFPMASAYADDAALGCKVLLCAAASAPGWQSISYCVPPMNQLFKMLAKGDGWPSCPQANASSVRYQPYQACPTGTQSYSQSAVNQGNGNSQPAWSADPNGPECIDPAGLSAGGTLREGATRNARTQNPGAYNVTLSPQDGTPFTFYFNFSE